jgi:hypothetical protein
MWPGASAAWWCVREEESAVVVPGVRRAGVRIAILDLCCLYPPFSYDEHSLCLHACRAHRVSLKIRNGLPHI